MVFRYGETRDSRRARNRHRIAQTHCHRPYAPLGLVLSPSYSVSYAGGTNHLASNAIGVIRLL